jgi:hypothetical protein|tara:strand:+ start:3288 stop:4106 length:819 start_codon:yes stop_codon:yes gene_type:complete
MIGKFNKIDGKVSILNKEGIEVDAKIGDNIDRGYIITTDSGFAHIKFDNEGLLTIGPKSRARISDLDMIDILYGIFTCSSARMSATTPAAFITTENTKSMIVVKNRGPIIITNMSSDGEVFVVNQAGRALLHKEKTTVIVEDDTVPPIFKNIQELPDNDLEFDEETGENDYELDNSGSSIPGISRRNGNGDVEYEDKNLRKRGTERDPPDRRKDRQASPGYPGLEPWIVDENTLILYGPCDKTQLQWIFEDHPNITTIEFSPEYNPGKINTE